MKINSNLLIVIIVSAITGFGYLKINEKMQVILEQEEKVALINEDMAKNQSELRKLSIRNDSVLSIVAELQNEKDRIIKSYMRRQAEVQRMNDEFMRNSDADGDGLPDDYFQDRIGIGDYNFNGIPDDEEY